VVALESIGLGSVYIGAMRNKPEEVARELKLPPNVFAVFGMAIAFPIRKSKPASSLALARGGAAPRTIFMGEAQIDAINTLDAKFRDFQKEQGCRAGLDSSGSLARARPGRHERPPPAQGSAGGAGRGIEVRILNFRALLVRCIQREANLEDNLIAAYGAVFDDATGLHDLEPPKFPQPSACSIDGGSNRVICAFPR